MQYYYRKLNFIIFYQEFLYLILIHDFAFVHPFFIQIKSSHFDQFNLIFINFKSLQFHPHQNIIDLLISINLNYLLLISIWLEIIILVFIVINYMLIIFFVLLKFLSFVEFMLLSSFIFFGLSLHLFLNFNVYFY
jgi:hypothetical protein